MRAHQARVVCQAAEDLGRRIAVVGALLVALVSMLQHGPVWLACLRGGVTLAVLGIGTRVGRAALQKALEFDRELADADKEKRT
jgi:hypothetical protein